jgi:hypothetical protein
MAKAKRRGGKSRAARRKPARRGAKRAPGKRKPVARARAAPRPVVIPGAWPFPMGPKT